jgi:hypothetical protein
VVPDHYLRGDPEQAALGEALADGPVGVVEQQGVLGTAVLVDPVGDPAGLSVAEMMAEANDRNVLSNYDEADLEDDVDALR